jgi:hypothetical protein
MSLSARKGKMRNILFGLMAALLAVACSKIPDKPVTEKLGIEELSRAIKADTSFSSTYEFIRNHVDAMEDLEKAKFYDITYRRVSRYVEQFKDTSELKKWGKEWDAEWEGKFGSFESKGDSIVSYWRNYLKENSLNRLVKFELADIKKSYYAYVGGVKDMRIGIRMTPTQGGIEQINFTYGFVLKIKDDGGYFSKRECLFTQPFDQATTSYWDLNYADRDKFENESVESFLQKYNLYFDVKDIRMNGVNFHADSIAIPKSIKKYFEYDKYPSLQTYFKDDVMKEFIDTSYIGKVAYSNKKFEDMMRAEDEAVYNFLAYKTKKKTKE